MLFETSQLWLIAAAAVYEMVVCMVWYSPSFFGTFWAKSCGISLDKCKHDCTTMIHSFIIHAIRAAVLLHFILITGATTIQEHIHVGLALVILLAASAYSSVLWEKKNVKAYLMQVACSAVSVIGMSVLYFYLAQYR